MAGLHEMVSDTGIAQSRAVARWVVSWLEPVWLCAMVVAYWHHSPPIRDDWVWLMWGAIPLFGLRWWGWGRLWTVQAFLLACVGFLLLTVFNYQQAPYARSDYGVLMVRPMLGIWLVIYCVETVRQWRTMMPLLAVSLVGGAMIVWLGLTASQWTPKSEVFLPVIDALPVMDYRAIVPDMLLSFNVNEMGGALSWVVPLMLGMALAPLPSRWRWLAWSAGVVGVAGLVAVILGQSRFAVFGVLGALLVMGGVLVVGRWRLVALVGVFALLVWQLSMNFPVVTLNSGATDEAVSAPSAPPSVTVQVDATLNQRVEIWERTIAMIGDYPLTGVGMSMFYLAIRDEPYIVTQLANRPPPHAHNALLQVGADLGVPGIGIWLLWHGIALFYLWSVWRKGTPFGRHLAVVLALSLGAHSFYGLGDAIKLWDRYAFVWWWLMGMVCALQFCEGIVKKTQGN